MDKLISISKASEMLGVSIDTLRQYDEKGFLVAKRTNGKHRRYLLSDIEKLQGKQINENKEDVICIYCRVSSQDQKQHGDLDRQKLRMLEYCASKQYKVGYVFEEVCSGMNAIRQKLNQIFDLTEQHKITKIVVEHSDRLARFFIPVFERYFKSHGVEVEYVEQVMSEGFEQELCKDLITLMSSFSAKIYGRRSAENRRKNKK